MSLKVLQILTRSNLCKGFLLKDICKIENLKSISVPAVKVSTIQAASLPVQIYPAFVTVGKLHLNNDLLKTSSIPLNIDPPKASILDLPQIPTRKEIIDQHFNNINLQYEDVPSVKQIEDPSPSSSPISEKRAARLIVIRRKKMKRHKLKKLRIRMKFEWAKRRQKRELKKEKEFQAELLGKIKEAEKFDAQAYCTEKIQKTNAVLLPKRWKGKRLPQFVITDLLEKQKKKVAYRNEMALKRKTMSMKVSDYPQ